MKGSNFAEITCSPLADPINGNVLYSAATDGVGNYVFDVTADHSCDAGFSLVGVNTRTCTGDGSSINGAFDGVAPTCERKRLIIPTQKNHYNCIRNHLPCSCNELNVFGKDLILQK